MTTRVSRRRFISKAALGAFGWGIDKFALRTTLSTICGTVTDPSGRVVVGVQITVTDVSTNISSISDNLGNFEIPDLKTGTYRLRAETSGFKTFIADNLLLESTQIRRVNVVLEVGESTSTLTVDASTEPPTLGQSPGRASLFRTEADILQLASVTKTSNSIFTFAVANITTVVCCFVPLERARRGQLGDSTS